MNLALIHAGVVWTIVSVILIRKRRMTPASALVFAATTALLLLPALASSRTIVPLDSFSRLTPWKESAPALPSNPVLNDVVQQFIPWHTMVIESWRAGEIPLWNGSAGAGYPLLANGQSGALSPLRLLTIPLPMPDASTSEAALKLLAAMLGTYLWLRRRRYADTAAITGAISYGLSSWMVHFLQFPHTAAGAAVPWVFLGIDATIERQDRRAITALALATAALFLAGHPETAAFVLLGAAIYAAVMSIEGRRLQWRPFLLTGAGVGIGTLLAAPLLLPLLEMLPRSQRFHAVRSAPPDSDPLSLRYLLNFVQPGHFGSFIRGTNWGLDVVKATGMYAGILGVAGVVGSLLGRRDRFSRFHALMAVVAMSILFVWPVTTTLLRLIPPFGLASVGPVRSLLMLALAVCAATVVRDLIEGDRARAVRSAAWTAVALIAGSIVLFPPSVEDLARSAVTAAPRLGLLILACSLAFERGRIAMITIAIASFAPATALEISRTATYHDAVWFIAALVCTAAIVAGGAIAGADKGRRLTLALLTLLVPVDLWLGHHDWNAAHDRKWFYASNETIDSLRNAVDSASEPMRITGTYDAIFPQVSAMFGMEDIRAHDPMSFVPILNLLEFRTGYSKDDYFALLGRLDDSLIDYLNVGYVMTSRNENLGDGWLLLHDSPGGRVWENLEVMPRFFVPERIAVIPDQRLRINRIVRTDAWSSEAVVPDLPPLVDGTRNGDASIDTRSGSAGLFELRIDARQPTLIASSQPYLPGWRIHAGMESIPALSVNETFLGFVVPAGRHQITIRYFPASFLAGSVLNLLTLAFLLLWPWLPR